MRVIGLTGSIGMGKTTTAAMFRARGVPVHDADAAVHRLYAGDASAEIAAAFPGVSTAGRVDRGRLSERVIGDAGALARLEAIVHPLVRASEAAFIEQAKTKGAKLALLDIPLLFETGRVGAADIIVVATATPEAQRARVLGRPGMTPEKFDALIARQIPDREKRDRAHFIVDSSRGFGAAERQVGAILGALSFMA